MVGEIVSFDSRGHAGSEGEDSGGSPKRCIRVHPRVHVRHPELDDEDVLHAWRNAFAERMRDVDSPRRLVIMALGMDRKGRVLEMLAIEADDGEILIYHAMTPPTRKALIEMGVV